MMERICRHCHESNPADSVQRVVALADETGPTGLTRTVMELACGHRFAVLTNPQKDVPTVG